MKQIPIIGLEKYKIDENSNIWSDYSSIYMKTKIINGYYTVNLKGKNYSVHRLVALTFIPNPSNLPVVNHKDSNKINNKVDNLEWVDQKTNASLHNKKISHERRVEQYENEKKINTYDSVTLASKAVGLSRSAISKACLGINKTASGYIWKYENQDYNHNDIDLESSKVLIENNNYYIFSNGSIYNNKRQSFLKPVQNLSGYCYVSISVNNKKKNFYIHVLVAKYFIGNPPDPKMQVNHKNKIRNDNRIENLEWVTQSQNSIHAKTYRPMIPS